MTLVQKNQTISAKQMTFKNPPFQCKQQALQLGQNTWLKSASAKYMTKKSHSAKGMK